MFCRSQPSKTIYLTPLVVHSAMQRDKNVVTISNRLNIYFDLMAIHLYSGCFRFVFISCLSPSRALALAHSQWPLARFRWGNEHWRWIYFSNLIKTNGKWLSLIGLTTLVCAFCSELPDEIHVRTIHFWCTSSPRVHTWNLAWNLFFVN